MTIDAGARKLVERMERDSLTLAVAESCTGGLVGGRITEVPGASKTFLGGVVAYANDVKVAQLGVDPALFADGHGAVSAAVATAMAHGVRSKFGAKLAIAVTGIAGPHGGTAGKPIGTVWLAALGPGDLVNVHRIHAEGDRAAVRAKAVDEAIRLLERNISEAENEEIV
ncbi:MAG: nicotinamide-nucleotide amidohydrolase family protein [Candidatus Thermoplasmatota archaeon]